MENSFGLFVSLFLGLFSIVRFRQLGKWVDEMAKDTPWPFPKKWHLVFAQAGFLIVGSLFVIFSLTQLVQLLLT